MSAQPLPDSLSARDRRLLSPEGLRAHRRRVVLVGSVATAVAAVGYLVLLVALGGAGVGDVLLGLGIAPFVGGMAATLSVLPTALVPFRAPMAASEGRGRAFRPLRRAVLRRDLSPLSPDDAALAVRWARTASAAGRMGQQGSTPMLAGLVLLQGSVLLYGEQSAGQAAASVACLVLVPLLLLAQVLEQRRMRRFLAVTGVDEVPS